MKGVDVNPMVRAPLKGLPPPLTLNPQPSTPYKSLLFLVSVYFYTPRPIGFTSTPFTGALNITQVEKSKKSKSQKVKRSKSQKVKKSKSQKVKWDFFMIFKQCGSACMLDTK